MLKEFFIGRKVFWISLFPLFHAQHLFYNLIEYEIIFYFISYLKLWYFISYFFKSWVIEVRPISKCYFPIFIFLKIWLVFVFFYFSECGFYQFFKPWTQEIWWNFVGFHLEILTFIDRLKVIVEGGVHFRVKLKQFFLVWLILLLIFFFIFFKILWFPPAI